MIVYSNGIFFKNFWSFITFSYCRNAEVKKSIFCIGVFTS